MTELRYATHIAVGLALIVIGVCWIIRPSAFERMRVARTPSAIRSAGVALLIIGFVFSSNLFFPE